MVDVAAWVVECTEVVLVAVEAASIPTTAATNAESEVTMHTIAADREVEGVDLDPDPAPGPGNVSVCPRTLRCS